MTILSLLGGGLARLLPEVFSLWKDYGDKKHELAMLQLQLDASEKLNLLKANLMESQLDVQAHQQLYSSLSIPTTGNKIVDFLNAIVRPSVVYVLLLLYTLYKLLSWAIIVHNPALTLSPWFIVSGSLFNDFDEMLLGSAISFFFVGRSFDKNK